MSLRVLAGSHRPDLEDLDLKELERLAVEVGAEVIRRQVHIEENYAAALTEDLFTIDNRQRAHARLIQLPQDAERNAQIYLMRAVELEKVPMVDRLEMDRRLDEWQREANALWVNQYKDTEAYTRTAAGKKAYLEAKKKAADRAALGDGFNTDWQR